MGMESATINTSVKTNSSIKTSAKLFVLSIVPPLLAEFRVPGYCGETQNCATRNTKLGFLMRHQKLAEDEKEHQQPGQYGEPHKPRALALPDHRDQANDPGGQSTQQHRDAVKG
jgi:hypothetical protein